MRLDKPIGSLLLLWPTYWGLWAASAGAFPDFALLLIFTLGTILMRSAGCVINDWADRDFDGHVERTRLRPLVTGEVGGCEALVLAAVLALLAFLLILPLPALVLWLSVPALLLAVSYPFTKRFLAIPQAYLGVAFGFGIPMAFAAQLGSVPPVGWLMLLANVFWAVAYDTEYAMVDREDDLKIGIRTSAITFGRHDVLAVMLCYGAFLGLMWLAGESFGAGWPYRVGLAVAAVLAVHHFTLIRTRSRDGCFKAFRHNNWLGAAVFAGMAADQLLRASSL
ncbi:MAG: 4-hydroxybenzoate polyprenyltransferase [Candidatus Dactylopiibacterium carminicum]|uniref:4-hydroxybenzoate octaprenyltransferase n=2 Tax=Candidatus Dactylopiibacterium carminicum TaxID=857335 RepID=A0A272ESW4_9RHOO|nr:4-hydroxybenzoate octaprenyltransferase [Candidatus Dactylopiibacterium carminicum]PAS93204.1 MAG: 4-hydroxybenzoate polyprenyltransferase [Candidatus Dactylopiibacterium carminicum]PAS95880.1 MAG: 4-hydroxybenzoate polyprenyltransferase [Candidatus Dactylopiibacterium carminicum]PAT00782.1 MAG: 4-hydroxybenzoate polyprenyltransferase [Candidatus Dactylopiibacterium carminicum]